MIFSDRTKQIVSIASGVLLCSVILFGNHHALLPILSGLIIVLFLFYLLFHTNPKEGLHDLSLSLLGIAYLALLCPYLALIRNLSNGSTLFLLLLVIVWLTDTGAYFIGKKWGAHKLYEKISPGKTIEGAVGGLVFALVGAYLYASAFIDFINIPQILIIAFLVSCIGQVGDLCESMIKRSFRYKDSGKIIPGHGGILDRIDALIFAAPLLYWFIS